MRAPGSCSPTVLSSLGAIRLVTGGDGPHRAPPATDSRRARRVARRPTSTTSPRLPIGASEASVVRWGATCGSRRPTAAGSCSSAGGEAVYGTDAMSGGGGSQMRTREPHSVREPQIGLQVASLAARQDKGRARSSGVGISAWLLALVLILSGTTWAPSESSAEEVYSALGDYSLVQGTRGWTYLDSTGAALTPDPGNGWWKGVRSYLLLGAGWGHPGSSRDAGRRWTAPHDGSAHITGTASNGNAGGGDGVVVSIRHGATVIWQATILNGNTTGVAYDLTRTMHQGETLDFVINRRSTNSYDTTNFNPKIVLTGGEADTTPPALSTVT